MKKVLILIIGMFLVSGFDFPTVPNSFSPRTVIPSTKINENYNSLLSGMTGSNKISAKEVYINQSGTDVIVIGNDRSITASDITATGNMAIAGNLAVTGDFSVVGDINYNNVSLIVPTMNVTKQLNVSNDATLRILSSAGTGTSRRMEMSIDSTTGVIDVYDDLGSDAPVLAVRIEGVNILQAGKTGVSITPDLTVNDDLTVGDVFTMSTPYDVRVERDASQETATGVAEAITWNIEIFDNQAQHSTASNTERLVAGATGTYLIVGQIEISGNATGYREIRINHSVDGYIAKQSNDNVGATISSNINVSAIYQMTAAEYVTLEAVQSSGGALNVLSTDSYFMMTLIH